MLLFDILPLDPPKELEKLLWLDKLLLDPKASRCLEKSLVDRKLLSFGTLSLESPKVALIRSSLLTKVVILADDANGSKESRSMKEGSANVVFGRAGSFVSKRSARGSAKTDFDRPEEDGNDSVFLLTSRLGTRDEPSLTSISASLKLLLPCLVLGLGVVLCCGEATPKGSGSLSQENCSSVVTTSLNGSTEPNGSGVFASDSSLMSLTPPTELDFKVDDKILVGRVSLVEKSSLKPPPKPDGVLLTHQVSGRGLPLLGENAGVKPAPPKAAASSLKSELLADWSETLDNTETSLFHGDASNPLTWEPANGVPNASLEPDNGVPNASTVGVEPLLLKGSSLGVEPLSLKGSNLEPPKPPKASGLSKVLGLLSELSPKGSDLFGESALALNGESLWPQGEEELLSKDVGKADDDLKLLLTGEN